MRNPRKMTNTKDVDAMIVNTVLSLISIRTLSVWQHALNSTADCLLFWDCSRLVELMQRVNYRLIAQHYCSPQSISPNNGIPELSWLWCTLSRLARLNCNAEAMLRPRRALNRCCECKYTAAAAKGRKAGPDSVKTSAAVVFPTPHVHNVAVDAVRRKSNRQELLLQNCVHRHRVLCSAFDNCRLVSSAGGVHSVHAISTSTTSISCCQASSYSILPQQLTTYVNEHYYVPAALSERPHGKATS